MRDAPRLSASTKGWHHDLSSLAGREVFCFAAPLYATARTMDRKEPRMVADVAANPYSLSLDEVRALAAQGNMIPLYLEIEADLETPVSAYLKVARGGYSFLLESIQGGEHMGRYSFIGTEPHTVLTYAEGTLERTDALGTRSVPCADPLAALRGELEGLRQVPQVGLPPLVGGAVGYLAYEVVRCYERLPIKDTPGLGVPDAVFMLSDTVLAF